MKNAVLTTVLSTILLIFTGCSKEEGVISPNSPQMINQSLQNADNFVDDGISVHGDMSDMMILKCLSLTFDQRQSLKNTLITEKRLQKTILSGFQSREIRLNKKYKDDVKYYNSLDTTEIALEQLLLELSHNYNYDLIVLKNERNYHIEESNKRIFLAIESILSKEQLEIWNRYKITGKLPCDMTEK